jgi:Transposase IS4
MDNYYTGIQLFKELWSMSIYSTGTVHTKRKGLDPQVTMRKEHEKVLKKNPGTTKYSSCGRFVYAGWFDKRPVHVLTNCHVAVVLILVNIGFLSKGGKNQLLNLEKFENKFLSAQF